MPDVIEGTTVLGFDPLVIKGEKGDPGESALPPDFNFGDVTTDQLASATSDAITTAVNAAAATTSNTFESVKLRINRLALDVTVPEIGFVAADTQAGATANQASIMRNAIAEVANGGRLIMPKGYARFAGRASTADPAILTVTGKTIHFEGQDTVWLLDSNNTLFSGNGLFDDTYSVVSFTSAAPTGATPYWLQTLVVDSPVTNFSGWKIGERVKIFAQDIITDSRNPYDQTTTDPVTGISTTKTYAARVGQIMTYVSATDNGAGMTFVVLRGQLYDPFTTNVRIARMNPAGQGLSVTGVTADMSDATFNAGQSNPLFEFRGLVKPRFDLTVLRNNTGTVKVTSCYGADCQLDQGYALDDAPNRPGYGILDTNSWGTVIHNSTFRHLRHGVTTIHSDIAPDYTDPAGYGRASFGKVHDSLAEHTTSSGFDTHNNAQFWQFHDNTAVDCGYAGQGMRGRYNTVRDCEFIDCDRGVSIITDTGGSTYGMRVENVVIRSARFKGIEVVVDGSTRDTRLNATVRDVTMIDAPADAITVQNANVVLEGKVEIGLESTLGLDKAEVIRLNNSSLRHNGTMVVDFSQVTKGLGTWLVTDMGTTSGTVSSLQMDNVEVYGGTQTVPAATTGTPSPALAGVLKAGSSSIMPKFRDIVYNDGAPAAVLGSITGYAVGGFIDYRDISNGGTSSIISFTDSDLTSGSSLGKIGRTLSPTITVPVTLSTAATTFGQLPLGRLNGQQLTLVNRSTQYAFSVGHGTSARTRTLTQQTRTILPGGSMTFFWSGSSWVETGPWPSLVARRTTDSTVVNNSVTLIDDDTLQLNLVPYATYRGRAVLVYDAGPTGDIKFGLTVPSGTTGYWTLDNPQIASASSTNTAISRVQLALTATGSAGGPAQGSALAAFPEFDIQTGATAGLFVIRYAQSTANATDNAFLKAGSRVYFDRTD